MRLFSRIEDGKSENEEKEQPNLCSKWAIIELSSPPLSARLMLLLGRIYDEKTSSKYKRLSGEFSRFGKYLMDFV